MQHQCCCSSADSQKQEEGPAFYAEIVFSLDHQRMEQTDKQECNKSDDYTRQIICFYKMHLEYSIYAIVEIGNAIKP